MMVSLFETLPWRTGSASTGCGSFGGSNLLTVRDGGQSRMWYGTDCPGIVSSTLKHRSTRSTSWPAPSWTPLIILLITLAVACGIPPPGERVFSIRDVLNLKNDSSDLPSFRIEGNVCAVVPEARLLVLQDESGSILFELPLNRKWAEFGSGAVIEGRNCRFVRGRYGIRIEGTPVVDIDGVHGPAVRTGHAILPAGRQAFRLVWFNQSDEGLLKVEYAAPGATRQRIPSRLLWHESGGEFLPGLDCQGYLRSDWTSTADFYGIEAVTSGIAGNFDASLRPRPQNSGLIFEGYLEVPEAGDYEFAIESDDGCILQIGSSCAVIPVGRRSQPVTVSMQTADADPSIPQWVEAEGSITFASHNEGRLELELAGQSESIQVTILHPRKLEVNSLLHRHARVTGLRDQSRNVGSHSKGHLLVPSAGQIELDPLTSAPSAEPPEALLTTPGQVRQLKRDEANRSIRAKLKGVVTRSTMTSMVVQDSTGGVYAMSRLHHWPRMPEVGEIWEIEGRTAAGDFSPMIHVSKATYLGPGTLPEPVRPAWDQLMNGSLDSLYVEIQGIPTSVSADAMQLLTRHGPITIRHEDGFPLPRFPDTSGYLGSLVRIRGCFFSVWDASGRVKTGEVRFASALMNVDEPKPADLFSLPTRKAAELIRFDASANTLRRAKIAGQLIDQRGGECFVLDGAIGFRTLSRQSPSLHVGDMVEAVGFPKLENTALILQEAEIRSTSRSDLPAPITVASEDLVKRNLDATLIQIEANLLGATETADEQVLRLQSGPHHFTGRLKSTGDPKKGLRPGSRLQLRGVYACLIESYPSDSLESFELLLEHRDSIVVLQTGPWWTVWHTAAVGAAIVGAFSLAGIWITVLHRTVAERTVQLKAEIEQRQIAEQRRVMEQERTRVAQDLHDELGAGLTEVSILGSLAQNPSISASHKETCLGELTEKSRSLVTALDEIVWAINPNYDSVGSLATYYSLFAQRFLNLAGIACRLQIEDDIPNRGLESSVRHGLFLSFREALNNIVRHSGATEAILKIEVAANELAIILADNGCGFDPGADKPGSDGLANMKARLEKLGGHFNLRSAAGRGTTVEFGLGLNGGTV